MKFIHKKNLAKDNSDTLSKTYKGILITFCLSILLHIILLVKIGLPFNKYNPLRNEPLQVKIINNSPIDESSDKNVSTNNLPQTKKTEAGTEDRLDHQPTSPTLKKPQTLNPQTKINNESITEPLIPVQEPNPRETPLEENQAQNLAEADQLIPANEVNMTFTITSVNDGKTLVLGEAEQHFTSDGRNMYQLSFTNKPSNTTNSDTAHSDEWSYRIRGRVFGNRLSPSLYEVKGQLAEQFFALSHETNNGNIVTTIGTGGRMPDGILDRQSLLYQFMFTPPKENDTQVLLSDGAKNSTYKSHLVGIELIDSEYFGKLKAVHMLMSNIDNNETIDIWLVPTFKYLPIKARYTSAQGNITELLTSTLDLK